MATTRIIPLHVGTGRSVAKALKDSVDYMENPLKTDNGEWISSYECDAQTADAEFLLAKQKYAALTGRSQGKKDVIAYHVRQSFKPGEVTPEQANAIGYDLAMRFTKGKHAFIVCTHTDKAHIHNHVVWNSTALDCRRKFRDFFRSGRALRRLSDLICVENGLSVIEKPQQRRGQSYSEWLGDNRPPSFQERLRRAIDAALDQKPSTFEDFLDLLRAAGVTVMDGGKHLKFLAPHEEGLPDQEKPTRCDTLRGEYTVEAIRERIAGVRVSSSAGRAPEPGGPRRISLIIDIETKLREGKGAAYKQWATIHNIKQMAKTLIALQEKGLDDYALLKEKTTEASARFSELSGRIRELESGLTANAELQKQLITYIKTRQTYIDYRKAGYSKKFRAMHEDDIKAHQDAKKFFDDLGYGTDKKLPTIKTLRAEYEPMLEEKKEAYREYRQAKSEMRELLTMKQNVDRFLNINERQPERRHLSL
jgi:hypothetical protein